MFSSNNTQTVNHETNTFSLEKCYMKVLRVSHTLAMEHEIEGYMYINAMGVNSMEAFIAKDDSKNVRMYREDGDVVTVRGDLDEIHDIVVTAQQGGVSE